MYESEVAYFDKSYSYRLAQAAVQEGLPRLKKAGIPTKRPDDYYAEMAKTDEHMKKVCILDGMARSTQIYQINIWHALDSSMKMLISFQTEFT